MSTSIDGFARCVNAACEAFDQDRPIQLVEDIVQQRGYPGEAFASMVITESRYVHPADDQDLECPDCGQPCAQIDKKPVVYPKAAIR